MNFSRKSTGMYIWINKITPPYIPDPRQINFSKEFINIPIDRDILKDQNIGRSELVKSYEESRNNSNLNFSFGKIQETKNDRDKIK